MIKLFKRIYTSITYKQLVKLVAIQQSIEKDPTKTDGERKESIQKTIFIQSTILELVRYKQSL